MTRCHWQQSHAPNPRNGGRQATSQRAWQQLVPIAQKGTKACETSHGGGRGDGGRGGGDARGGGGCGGGDSVTNLHRPVKKSMASSCAEPGAHRRQYTVGSSSSSSGGFIGNGPAAATAAATASHLTAGAAGLLPLAGCKSHEQEAGRGEVREAAALTMRLSQESSGGAGGQPRSADARWHLPWG